MKPIKIFSSLFIILLLSSCIKERHTQILSVSIAPQKFFLEKIGGQDYQINILVPPGMSPENYDPTPSDIAGLSYSKLYFYIGTLGFEQMWLKSIKDQNEDLACIDVSKNLPELTDDHTHDHCGCIHGDPHFWTSIMGANAIAKSIYNTLIEKYPEKTQEFAQNYDLLNQEINDVEEYGRKIINNTKSRSFVIYHPSLSYFAREWGLKQIVIEQEGKSPSPSHIAKVIEEAKNDSVKIVFLQKEFDTRVAETIAKSIGADIYEINPLDEDWNGQMKHLFNAFAE